jgi:hypothetical protein
MTTDLTHLDGWCPDHHRFCGNDHPMTTTTRTAMILATLSTRSFDFTALAHTREDADTILLAAWHVHVQQTDADDDLMRDAIADGDVNYADITPGTVLRDRETLWLAADAPTTPETCVGYDREPHTVTDGTRGGLCPRCDARLDRDVSLRALVDDWRQRATELSPPRSETYENDPDDETNDTIADTYVDLANALADAIGYGVRVGGTAT